MFKLTENPSEGGSWQRVDNVWSALPFADNFFLLDLISNYTGVVVEILNVGLPRKTLGPSRLQGRFDD